MRLTVIHKTYTAYFKSKVSFRKSWVALKRAVVFWAINPRAYRHRQLMSVFFSLFFFFASAAAWHHLLRPAFSLS